MAGSRRHALGLSRSLCCLLGCVALTLSAGACDDTPDGRAVDGRDAGSTATGGGNSGGGSGNTDLSDADLFLRDYASAVCAMYEPCCNAEGQGFDAAGCTDWFARVSAAYLPDGFLPEVGAECMRGLAAARAADPDRCNTVGVFDRATLRSECDRAFVAPAREGSALGGACTLAGDCAATGSEAGTVICYGGMCVLQRRGAAGDGPCYAGGGVPLELEMYTCDGAPGLYCHRGDNVCAPRVGDGERCPYSNACDESAMCSGGLCRRLPDRGEPCLNAVPGAGGYCRAGSVCDVPTLTCGPALALGEPCSEARPCESGVCIDGFCTRSDWQRNLNCTG